MICPSKCWGSFRWFRCPDCESDNVRIGHDCTRIPKGEDDKLVLESTFLCEYRFVSSHCTGMCQGNERPSGPELIQESEVENNACGTQLESAAGNFKSK